MTQTKSILWAAALLAVPLLASAEGGNGEKKAFRERQRTTRQAHHQTQKQENQAFRGGLKGKSEAEKNAAVTAHHEQQHAENKAFNEELRQKNMDFLKTRLAANTRLTEAQKDELSRHFESQYAENVSFRDERYNASVANFEKIAGDPTLTQNQKKAAVKAYRDQNKTEAAAHREQQKNEDKALRQKMKSEKKPAPTAP